MRERGVRHRIIEVHVVRPEGESHPHIELVKLRDGSIETRQEVIRYIDVEMEYITSGPRVPPSRLLVAACPHCGSDAQLTTAYGSSETNHLLRLPRF